MLPNWHNNQKLIRTLAKIFVNCKGNEYWVWLAIDRKTRKIVGCFVGDRTRESARKWESLPRILLA